MTRELMAKVVFENYDPQFASRTQAGDVVVGGFNFGTGSSREQAVTALQAKGLPLVIAGSFSQTYLRNAFNNGFLCIECPEFVSRLKLAFAPQSRGQRKDGHSARRCHDRFHHGNDRYRGERFQFPAMGAVPQSLVVAGGVEKLVAGNWGCRRGCSPVSFREVNEERRTGTELATVFENGELIYGEIYSCIHAGRWHRQSGSYRKRFGF